MSGLGLPVAASGLDACGFIRRSLIIWDKGHIVIGRGHYHWRHESCWYAVKKGAQAHWKGDRKALTLWEIDNPGKSETGHSAQKPVECMQRAIHNHKGDVYDPFVGSGTTIIAVEQEQCRCYALEIERVVRSGPDIDSWPRTGFSRRRGEVTRAGWSARVSEPCFFARRMQDTGAAVIRRRCGRSAPPPYSHSRDRAGE